MTASARPRTQDQWEFTEELLKRLQESTEERLPTTIDTFFNQHSIRLTHHAANLPSLANNLRGQLHPLLSGNIRRLDLHVKISLRPIHEPTSTHDRHFQVVNQHIEHCWDQLPMLLSQLPHLRQFTLTLDSLFDSTPRPRDYQRLKLFRHQRLWGSRPDNIRHSDFQEKATAVLVPMMRGLARGGQLDRVAIRHVPLMTDDMLKVICGATMSDEEVARQFLTSPGMEVVLKGWDQADLGRKDSFLTPMSPFADEPPPPPRKEVRHTQSTPHLHSRHRL